MFENFEDKYKKDLLTEIRKNINIYNNEFQNKGYIEYSGRSPKENNVVKIIGTIWGIILFSIISFVIYKEAILPMKINISSIKYLIITGIIFILLLFTIIISIKNTKRISKFILNKNILTISFIKSKTRIENKFKLDDLKFFVRSRRKTTETNLRHGTFNVYITYNNEKNKYILNTENETEFFVFLLFLEMTSNNININELTDENLYEMYHSKYYGLKY